MRDTVGGTERVSYRRPGDLTVRSVRVGKSALATYRSRTKMLNVFFNRRGFVFMILVILMKHRKMGFRNMFESNVCVEK